MTTATTTTTASKSNKHTKERKKERNKYRASDFPFSPETEAEYGFETELPGSTYL